MYFFHLIRILEFSSKNNEILAKVKINDYHCWMIEKNKVILYQIMENEGNAMFYPFKAGPNLEDFHEWINSRKILKSVDFLAKEYNGRIHYFKESSVDYKPGIILKITYRFNDLIDNLLFRSLLIENKIPYQTTGLQDTTYLEFTV
jgi:hypothetical protein